MEPSELQVTCEPSRNASGEAAAQLPLRGLCARTALPSWGMSVSAPPTTSHRLSLLPARRGSRSQNRVRLFVELCNLPAPPPPCPLLQSCPWPRPSTGDPVEFLSWLLNTLHLALGGSKKAHSSESTHDLGGKQCVHFCLSFAALEQYVCAYQ